MPRPCCCFCCCWPERTPGDWTCALQWATAWARLSWAELSRLGNMVILALISGVYSSNNNNNWTHNNQLTHTHTHTETKNARSTCHICHMSWRTSFIMRRLPATTMWLVAGSRLHQSVVSPCPGSNCGRRATLENFNYTFNLRWAFCVSQCNINSSQGVCVDGGGGRRTMRFPCDLGICK